MFCFSTCSVCVCVFLFHIFSPSTHRFSFLVVRFSSTMCVFAWLVIHKTLLCFYIFNFYLHLFWHDFKRISVRRKGRMKAHFISKWQKQMSKREREREVAQVKWVISKKAILFAMHWYTYIIMYIVHCIVFAFVLFSINSCPYRAIAVSLHLFFCLSLYVLNVQWQCNESLKMYRFGKETNPSKTECAENCVCIFLNGSR